MSKRAEEAALKAYPVHNIGDATLPYGEWDLNGVSRRGFQEGYEQAEKDIICDLLEWAKENQYKSLTIVADNFWQEVIEKIN
jgi:hypothetical protein